MWTDGTPQRVILLILSSVILSGCATELDRPFYSPDFLSEAIGYPTTESLPKSCLGPDEQGSEATLPLGCANNLNLQRMVENASDLQRGQDVGPTLSAPVARAAERYIQGEEPFTPPPSKNQEALADELQIAQ
jgi:type IV pilus biogenesis protein CpaD/CtpE